MIWDMEPFINLVVGETADSCINVQADVEDAFLAAARADNRVEKVYLYHSAQVSHVGGVELLATMCDDFGRMRAQSLLWAQLDRSRLDEKHRCNCQFTIFHS